MNDDTRKQLIEWIGEKDWETVAAAVDVSVNTLSRWISGLSKPHPNSLKIVKAGLAERASQKFEGGKA